MSDESKPKNDTELLDTARARYNRALEVETSNRDHALEALKFRDLQQWNPEVRNLRENDPEGARPCIVVDKTNQYLRQVVNDERQNRPAIKVRPVDDKGDPEVADILQGIVRHVEDKSGADLAYDTAYEAAVDGGFGYIRILTEYCNARSHDQDIVIKRVRNRFTILLDPEHQEPDGSDSKWAFVIEKMSHDDFKRAYPYAQPLDFQSDGRTFANWVSENFVIVAEYFFIEPVKKELLLWRDGQTSLKDEPLPQGIFIGELPIKSRKTTINTVKWRKITAKEVLEEGDIPGKYIPIVEVIGNEIDIEGKRHLSGLLKPAMEPQKIHNIAASNFVEMIMLAPRSQWVAAEGQIEGYEEKYRTANRRNISVLPYKPVVADGNQLVPPPQRTPPAGVPVGWMQTMQNTEHDIQASMGMYAQTTLGLGDAQSGRQEALQQRRGDTATFHYMDNLSRSIRQVGRILVDWIPVYYDARRVARIVGEDGTADHVMLDPEQPQAVRKVQDEQGAIKKIYNLGVGEYDVAVTTGPSFTTKRQEAVTWMTEIIQASPDLMKVGGDIMFRNMDAPGADEWADRLKKLLPPELADDDEEAPPMVPTPQGPVPVPQAAQMIGQLMQAAQQMAEQLKKADFAKAHKEALDAQNRQQELAIEADRVSVEMFNAETTRFKEFGVLDLKNAEVALKDKHKTIDTALELSNQAFAASQPKPEQPGVQ